MDKKFNDMINISYNSLKYKFEKLELLDKNNSNKEKIRILLLDLTFIYNFLYGFFIKSKYYDIIFNNLYKNLHIIELLNFIAHYRRYFYHKINAIDYIYIYKSINIKQNKPIYKEIFDFLRNFSNYIPNLFIFDGLDKTHRIFYNLIESFIDLKNLNNKDYKIYTFSNDNNLKSLIFSLCNKKTCRDNVIIDVSYRNNKIDMNYFEETQILYKDLFISNDKILSQKFKDKYYEFLILFIINKKLNNLKKKGRIELFKNIVNKKIEIKNILSEEEYLFYEKYLIQLYSKLYNDNIKNVIDKLMIDKKVDLYDKNLLHINQNYLKNQLNPLCIEWLMEME